MAAAHFRCYTERSESGNVTVAGALMRPDFCQLPLGSGFVLFPVSRPRPCPFYSWLHPLLSFLLPTDTPPFHRRAFSYSTATSFSSSGFSLPLQPPSYIPSHPFSNLGFWNWFPFGSLPTHISLFPVLIPEMLVPPCCFPVLAWLVKGACPGMCQELRSYERSNKSQHVKKGRQGPSTGWRMRFSKMSLIKTQNR